MSAPWISADRPRRVEVISSVDDLRLAFGTSAVSHEATIEVSMRPTARWVIFGKFALYTFHVAPTPVDASSLESEYKQRNLKSVVWVSESAEVKFSVDKKEIDRAYIDVAFSATKKADEPGLNVLIPLSLAKEMLDKKPNQSPEPTVMSVTPRADARVAPATTVAHL